MVKHLPEWIMKRYANLWNKFKDKELTNEQIKNALDNDGAMAVFLSELKKAEWLEMKMSQEDSRKTIYKLKDPQKAILEEIKELSKK